MTFRTLPDRKDKGGGGIGGGFSGRVGEVSVNCS